MDDDDYESDDQLEWRDTYFILFQSSGRPTLTQVEGAITGATRRVTLENLEANEDGLFESVLVQAPEDHAALEISYETGDAVIEQSAQLAKQLKGEVTPDQLKRLLRADARLDVMHFERVSADSFDDDDEFAAGALDPGSLLNVVEALAKLTRGLPIDPASGAILT
ncbi:MAG TPA: hypothetical protein VGM76_02955 [Lacipirellulaceae bacterium]|jgi:hypothetical protein